MTKELKALNRIKDFMSANAIHWKQDIGMIETALKALEIIKDKMVIPVYIMNAENVEEYNRQLKQITFKKDYEVRKLTKEQFDLLKEVLL